MTTFDILESLIMNMSKLILHASYKTTMLIIEILSCIWDLNDEDSNTIPTGEYSFFVKVSLR